MIANKPLLVDYAEQETNDGGTASKRPNSSAKNADCHLNIDTYWSLIPHQGREKSMKPSQLIRYS